VHPLQTIQAVYDKQLQRCRQSARDVPREGYVKEYPRRQRQLCEGGGMWDGLAHAN
jgi:hypothetical protein